MSFYEELKRRNVLRVGAAYVVASWLLIQVAETIFPLFGFNDTPARIVVIVLSIGLIPALVFSWVFELTPEGVKKEQDIDRPQSIAPQTGKKMDRIIMLIMSLALTYFVADKFLFSTSSGVTEQQTQEHSNIEPYVKSAIDEASIAVLPFRNISPEPENEYFADGMTEEVMNLLANVQDLRVISRSSSFVYKNRVVPIAQVGRELNVAHVLEGSVRRFEQKVRISVQLTDARADDQQWSNTWEGDALDIFELQNQVASDIVAQMQDRFAIGDFTRRTKPTENLEAYHLYLKARELWWRRGSESVGKSIRMFEEVIEMDPGFALAHAGLASALYIDTLNNPLRGKEEWRQPANRAHELDPSLAEPLLLEGDYQLFPDRDPESGIRLVKQALSLEPNSAWTNHMVSIFWAAGGGLQKSLLLAEKAHSLDPLVHNINANLGKVHMLLGNNTEARHYLDIATELGMGGELHWVNRAIVFDRLGDEAGAQANAEQAAEALGLPDHLVPLMFNPVVGDRVDEIEDATDVLPPLVTFYICLRSGQLECAIGAFSAAAMEYGSVPLFSLIWLEEAKPIRQRPDFPDMLKKFNWRALKAYWDIEGWPDVCPQSVDALNCKET